MFDKLVKNPFPEIVTVFLKNDLLYAVAKGIKLFKVIRPSFGGWQDI